MIKHSIPLQEPVRWKELLTQTNENFVSNPTTSSIAPILTDGIVFVYPILLVIRYLLGTQAGKEEFRYWALYVTSSAAAVTILALIIQYFVDKQRPEWYIDNADLLIMDHLPTAPFPSDHASVGAAVWVSVLLRALQNNNKPLIIIWVLLVIAAVVMSISRVGVAIHRPTDVIVWFILWTIVAALLHPLLYQDSWFKKILSWIVDIQEWLFSLIGFR